MLRVKRDPKIKVCEPPFSNRSLILNPAHQNYLGRTSLVVQWLGIHLPMQETQVQALVWEDPTCCGATKPVYHNY